MIQLKKQESYMLSLVFRDENKSDSNQNNQCNVSQRDNHKEGLNLDKNIKE